MANDIKLISGTSHPELAKEIADELGLALTRTRTVRFGNENILFQCLENVRESDVFVIQTSCPPVSDGIVELLIMIDALRHASARRITAVLPYFPYARSDKKDRPRISITARLIADLLQTAGADRVLTMNLHSPQVQGFFHIPVDQLDSTPLICDYLLTQPKLDTSVLVASDIGEAKDLEHYAHRLKLPMAIVDKRRYDDSEQPVAVGMIGDVVGQNALIVDDEIASAGTMVAAVEFLKSQGVKHIDAAAVHPVMSGNAKDKLDESAIERIVVTNSIPIPLERRSAKVEVVSVAKLFADAIRAIHGGASVSELFR